MAEKKKLAVGLDRGSGKRSLRRKAIFKAGRSRPRSIWRSRSKNLSWSKALAGVGKTANLRAIAAWRGMKSD